MNWDAVRTTPSLSTRSPLGLVLLIVIGLMSLSDSVSSYGEDGPVRATAPAVGIRLPPRSTGPEPGTSSNRKSSSINSLWTTAISLAAIVGCLMLVGYWLKPYLGLPRGLPIDAVELLGRRVIEQKVAIHLVRCGERVLILGVSPDGARTLSEITDPGEVQRLVDACQPPRDSKPATSISGSVTAESTFPGESPRRV